MSDQPVALELTEVGVLQKFDGDPQPGDSPVETIAAVDGEVVLIVEHPEPGVDDVIFENPDHPKWNHAVRALGGDSDGTE